MKKRVLKLMVLAMSTMMLMACDNEKPEDNNNVNLGDGSQMEQESASGEKTTEIEYYYDDPEKIGSITEYDEYGGYVKKTWYSRDGVVTSIREYLDNGWKTTWYEADGSVTSSTIFYYADEAGVEREEMYDGNGSLVGYVLTERNADGDRTKVTKYYANGNLKQEVEYHHGIYTTKDKQYGEDGTITNWEETEYNENNDILKKCTYDKDGNIIERSEVTYWENGEEKSSVKYGPNDVFYNSYEYDENGKIVRNIYTLRDSKTDKISSYTEREFNADGKIVKITYRDENKIMTSIVEYEYDGNGNRTKETVYDKAGSLEYYCVYEYDTNSVKTKETKYNPNGSMETYTVYEYNGDGKVAKDTTYDANGNLEEYTVYEYNVDGYKQKSTTYDKNGNVIGTSTTK